VNQDSIIKDADKAVKLLERHGFSLTGFYPGASFYPRKATDYPGKKIPSSVWYNLQAREWELVKNLFHKIEKLEKEISKLRKTRPMKKKAIIEIDGNLQEIEGCVSSFLGNGISLRVFRPTGENRFFEVLDEDEKTCLVRPIQSEEE
jgi:hypothetical protein